MVLRPPRPRFEWRLELSELPSWAEKPQNSRISGGKVRGLGDLTFDCSAKPPAKHLKIELTSQGHIESTSKLFPFLFGMSMRLVLTRASGLLRESAACRRCIRPQFRFASSACFPQLTNTDSLAYTKYNWEDPLEFNSLLTDEEKQISYGLGKG
jgi:hypothetical protein